MEKQMLKAARRAPELRFGGKQSAGLVSITVDWGDLLDTRNGAHKTGMAHAERGGCRGHEVIQSRW